MAAQSAAPHRFSLTHLILSGLRHSPWLTAGALLFQALQTGAAVILPTLNADIINDGVATGDTGRVLELGGQMLLLTLAQGICTVIAVLCAASASMRLGRDLRHSLFRRVNAFSETQFSKFGTPTLITRNTNDVQQVQMLVLLGFTLMVSAPLMAVGGVIAAIRLDATLSLVLAVSVPVLLVIMVLAVGRMLPQFRTMQSRTDSINRIMREQLSGLRVIRAFVREPEERTRFGVANDALTHTSDVVGRLFAILFPVIMLVLNVSSVAVLWFGASRVDSGATSVGTLIAFLSYLMQVLMSVTMAAMISMMIPRAQVCAGRIHEVLALPPARASHPASTTPGGGTGASAPLPPTDRTVSFDAVSFQYPGAERPVLRDISFETKPGTTTAIVGSTGSGKSTLVRLIPRLFDATGGCVRIGGTPVGELADEDLWAQLGYVPQKAFLFSGTVASNLRLGAPEATDDELWLALRTAQAEAFVRELPEGLDAPVAQGGTNFSGGQRQRLAIARALVRRAGILIFDDSFSALDTATDAALRAALPEYTRDAVTFIVAQRISSIRDADQIAVLDHGGLAGLGTHAELLRTSRVYQEIATSQITAEEASE